MYHLHSPFMLNLNLDQDVKGPLSVDLVLSGKREMAEFHRSFSICLSTSTKWRIHLLSLVLNFLETLTCIATVFLEYILISIFSDTSKLSGFKTKLIIILTKEPIISCWYDFSFNNCDTTRWYVIIINNYLFCARFFNKRSTILISISHSRLIVKLTLW